MALKGTTSLRTGLKQSEAVVRAMGEGKHFLLAQRVQSPDFKGHFPIRDLEFFLVPDSSGLDRGNVRPEFQEMLDGKPDNDGKQVTVRYKASAVEVVMVPGIPDLAPFSDWHIWTEEHLRGQLEWDPTDPPYLLTCKVTRLDPPVVIPWQEAYGGSSPWIRIQEEELPPLALEPVIEHKDFLKVVVDFKKALAEAQKNPVERPEAAAAAAAPAKPAAAGPKDGAAG